MEVDPFLSEITFVLVLFLSVSLFLSSFDVHACTEGGRRGGKYPPKANFRPRAAD